MGSFTLKNSSIPKKKTIEDLSIGSFFNFKGSGYDESLYFKLHQGFVNITPATDGRAHTGESINGAEVIEYHVEVTVTPV